MNKYNYLNDAFQDYKGYRILIKWSVGIEIMKVYRGKWFVLFKSDFYFNKMITALHRASTYIDEHTDKLEIKFKEEFIKFAAEVDADPLHYAEKFPEIDVKYYLIAHKKIQNENR